MKVYHSLEEYQKGERTVATIGTFDGVHVGHKKILERIVRRAKEMDGESVLISFHPHPRLILFPDDNNLRLLQTLDEKIYQLEKLGIDKLLVIPFSKAFSRISSRSFIEDILVNTVGIKSIVIGYDHKFGKNRTGGIEELREFAGERYEVEEIQAETINHASVSSTKIRLALQGGNIRTASEYLGYNYSFAGEVVRGEQRGRQLGYPTANIQLDEPLKMIPKEGVYVVKAKLGQDSHYGLLSIGKKETVGEFPITLEVYIFDFDRDIYAQTLEVEMLAWIRGQKKFDSLDELIVAMKGDEEKALNMIASHKT